MHFRFLLSLLFLLVRIYAQHDCFYNTIHGFCVTVDENLENAECRALDGWLQFYAAGPHQPWPHTYMGCGDDGIVLMLQSSRLIVACLLSSYKLRSG